jgi:hypothetical protein
MRLLLRSRGGLVKTGRGSTRVVSKAGVRPISEKKNIEDRRHFS